MTSYSEMANYPIGTILLRTSGYRFIKTHDKKWVSEHRMIAAQKLVERDLLPNERVFHRDGKRDNNMPTNLVVIRFNLKKFEKLPHTRVIYIPVRRAEAQKTMKRPVGRPRTRELIAA